MLIKQARFTVFYFYFIEFVEKLNLKESFT